MEQTRQAQVYGVRPVRTFEQAAAKFVLENQHKRSIGDDVGRLKELVSFIGHISLNHLHMGLMRPWITHKQRQGRTIGTINNYLQIVRRIVNLAAGEWVDDNGMTWLQAPAKFRLLPNRERRQPYPLSWEEQDRLFRELPAHLAKMALFAVNTGCRASEICALRWDWEVKVPEMGTSVFIVPGEQVKNGYERLVVLNRISRSIVAGQVGKHPSNVFPFDGMSVKSMLNTAWKKARARAGLPQVRVHDLKHTFGRRLRAAGVGFEDRQDLLGHRSGSITTHYSAVELSRLIEATERVVERNGTRPEIVVLRGKMRAGPRKTPATEVVSGVVGRLTP
jgi:integrase